MIPRTQHARSDFFPSFITDDLAALELLEKKKNKNKKLPRNGVIQLQMKYTIDIGMHACMCSLGYEEY